MSTVLIYANKSVDKIMNLALLCTQRLFIFVNFICSDTTYINHRMMICYTKYRLKLCDSNTFSFVFVF